MIEHKGIFKYRGFQKDSVCWISQQQSGQKCPSSQHRLGLHISSSPLNIVRRLLVSSDRNTFGQKIGENVRHQQPSRILPLRMAGGSWADYKVMWEALTSLLFSQRRPSPVTLWTLWGLHSRLDNVQDILRVAALCKLCKQLFVHHRSTTKSETLSENRKQTVQCSAVFGVQGFLQSTF